MLLGVGPAATPAEVEPAWRTKRDDLERLAASAPSEGLRARYIEQLSEVDEALSVLLLAGTGSGASRLRESQMRDLAGASPTGAIAPGDQLNPGSVQVIAGRYELRSFLAAGGMGAVYRAWDPQRKEEVAVKLLLPRLASDSKAIERFLGEARTAGSLSHPQIVKVWDFGMEGQTPFLVMELLRGRTLRDLFKALFSMGKSMNEAEALALANAIGHALAFAHRSTVHRDVKPENIWVTEGGGYKLMDFGLAKLENERALSAVAGGGTAYYMAPEQLREPGSVDRRADQYALAVVLYEALCGEVPMAGSGSVRKRRPAVSKAFSDAIDRALSPNPKERYSTITEFVESLSRSGGSKVGSNPFSVGRDLGIFVRSWRGRVLVLIIVIWILSGL